MLKLQRLSCSFFVFVFAHTNIYISYILSNLQLTLSHPNACQWKMPVAELSAPSSQWKNVFYRALLSPPIKRRLSTYVSSIESIEDQLSKPNYLIDALKDNTIELA